MNATSAILVLSSFFCEQSADFEQPRHTAGVIIRARKFPLGIVVSTDDDDFLVRWPIFPNDIFVLNPINLE